MGLDSKCFEIFIDPSLIITALSIRENFSKSALEFHLGIRKQLWASGKISVRILSRNYLDLMDEIFTSFSRIKTSTTT